MFQLIARHLLHTLNIIVVESFTTPHYYCPMSVQPLPALTVTTHQRLSVDGQQSVFFFQYRILLKKYCSHRNDESKKIQRGATTGWHVVSSLCLYCGGIHAMLRKRADKLKIK